MNWTPKGWYPTIEEGKYKNTAFLNRLNLMKFPMFPVFFSCSGLAMTSLLDPAQPIVRHGDRFFYNSRISHLRVLMIVSTLSSLLFTSYCLMLLQLDLILVPLLSLKHVYVFICLVCSETPRWLFWPVNMSPLSDWQAVPGSTLKTSNIGCCWSSSESGSC